MTPERIQELLGHAVVRQIGRFAVVGVIATAVHYAVMVALVEIGRVTPVAATTIGYGFGIVVSYTLNRRFTFQARGTPVAKSFAKFVVLYGVGAFLNGAIVGGLIAVGAHYLLAQVVATGLVLVWNFLGARYVVFR
ncbi:MAG TPA: GtrA family protein [Vitreimonas sp.]|uniref:GtrA family protein n=1 Tax=Vitreimonas sp. TaxID=3069702 RepID=UPI002D4EA84E|nr:GtrA family protein [Vitreimonas sp.]HYD87855.1 GtrA family protein [Vitreimonas sp.]